MAFAAAIALAVATGPAAAQESPAEHVVRPVRLMVLEADSRWPERRFFGEVVARQTVDLAFQVSGQMVAFPVVEGQRLADGELIAELDLEPFELRLSQAQLRFEQAERTLDRAQQLGPGTVSQASIDDAQTETATARIAVREAEYALDRATLHAPFDALVASRLVANFTTVNAGTAVVRIHDMSELRVEIDVPEVLFRRVQASDVFDLYAVLTGSDHRYPLEVREFEAETSAIGQTYTITLAMVDVDDRLLLPGASVTVVARQLSGEEAVYLPPTAVVIAPDRSTHVMVFEPTGADGGTVRAQPVEVEAAEDGRLRVVSGVRAGMEIVAAGAGRVADGEVVRRFTGFGN